MTENAKFVEILLVEDSPTDAELTRLALSDGKIDNNLHRVADGVAALSFPRRGMSRRVDDLTHAFMVKVDCHAAGRVKNGRGVAQRRHNRAIDLKARAAVKFNSDRRERATQ